MSENEKRKANASASAGAAAEKDLDRTSVTSPVPDTTADAVKVDKAEKVDRAEASADAGDRTESGVESSSDGVSDAPSDTRSLRRVERAAKKAKRAQDKADRARAEALDAVRASGLGIIAGEDGGVVERDDSDDRLDSTEADDDGGADEHTGAAPSADGVDADTTGPVSTSGKDSGEKGTATTKGTAASSTPEGKGGSADGNAKAAGAAAASGRTARRREGNATLATILLVVAALLTIGGIVGWVAYSGQSSAATAEQRETDAPQEAADSARQIVTQMFTYDYDKVDDQLGQVEGKLTGDAEKEFRETTRPKVSELAKSVQANSYATVAAVGITEHPDPDHVGTVMMLNRMVSTKDQPEAQNSATRLKVSMERVPGADGAEPEWKVAKVEVL